MKWWLIILCVGTPLRLFANDYIVSTNAQGTAISKWDITTGQYAGRFDSGVTLVGAAKISRTAFGTFFVQNGPTLVELDGTGAHLRTRQIQGQACLSPAGTILTTDEKEYDYDTGLLIRTLPIVDATWILNIGGNEIVTLSGNTRVNVYSYPTFALLRGVDVPGSDVINSGAPGELLVSAINQHRVLRINLSTMENVGVAAQGAGLEFPMGVCDSPGGSVFVGTTLGTIFEFRNGEFVRFIPPVPGLGPVYSMCRIDSDDCDGVIVGDLDNDRDVDVQDLAYLLANFGRVCN